MEDDEKNNEPTAGILPRSEGMPSAESLWENRDLLITNGLLDQLS